MLECGFEFEFGHNVRLDLIKQLIKLHYPKNKIYTLDDDSYVEKILSKNYFIFKRDDSVFVKSCKNINTELVTPVFIGEKEICENFDKLLNILKILNIKTNYTCSIHINIGFSTREEIEKINLAKLYLYADERKYLKIFKRSNNRYCRTIISINKLCELFNKNTTDVLFLKKLEKHILFLEKDRGKSITLDKCKNDKYIIEFRFIGGDYINMKNETSNTLKHIIDSMNFSIGKSNKKVSKVINDFKQTYII